MKILRSPVRAAAGLAAVAALSLGITAPGASAAGCDLKPGASCHHVNLDGQDLSGRDLRHVDLTYASLKGTSFVGANLDSAILKHADLRGARFHRANLSRANLQAADMERATVDGASAPHADFRHARVVRVDFARTNLQHASFGGADALEASFNHAPLQNAAFNGTELQSASFEHATFHNTNFEGSKVAHTRFFPSNIGDDATARRSLFTYVYLHLDAYKGFGSCGSNPSADGVRHTSKTVTCSATGQGATTIPNLRGSGVTWGWEDHGDVGFFKGTGGTRLYGAFSRGTFGTFTVHSAEHLGLSTHVFTFPKTLHGKAGHPGGPLAVELTAVSYGYLMTGYVQRLSGWLQRGR